MNKLIVSITVLILSLTGLFVFDVYFNQEQISQPTLSKFTSTPSITPSITPIKGIITPTPIIIYVTVTPKPSATPTPTPSITLTPTPSITPTPTIILPTISSTPKPRVPIKQFGTLSTKSLNQNSFAYEFRLFNTDTTDLISITLYLNNEKVSYASSHPNREWITWTKNVNEGVQTLRLRVEYKDNWAELEENITFPHETCYQSIFNPYLPVTFECSQ